MKEKNKEKKFQYSKLLPIITGIIFIGCLYHVFSVNLENYVDLTVMATCVTVSGGIFGSTILGYVKKAQSENNVKLKIELYKTASRERLKYNEQMMILKKKYEFSDEQIMELENESPMDDYELEALSSIQSIVNMAESEAESPVEMQTY
jgi:hypothetical protein